MLARVEQWRTSGIVGQLVRFGIAGGLATLIYTIVYWPLATYGHRILWLGGGAVWPLVANVMGYLAAMVSGYHLHSRWSFRGHGARAELKTSSRFFAVSLVSFGLNSVFVWVLTGPLLHGPTWWPLLPILFVTPLITFALNRLWVFA